ncbi:thiol-disulfide oxidoreductase DCC family protein [Cytobacillus sp. FJAT-53684]|uniref:Thiol-disulfide oxidoreductase DCC family protein n=1 Tax=Cytobacillus mangrovibacter TaxID=3299024 RepID=A0ABW6JXB9_9BACI
MFDGECNFCDHSVQFIIKREKGALYKFAALQSEAGQALLKKYRVPSEIDSIVLLDGDRCYFRSSAALRICKNLKGGWQLLYGLLIMPKPIRDYFYRILAKNRYKWFGKKDSCMIPPPEIRDRFL